MKKTLLLKLLLVPEAMTIGHLRIISLTLILC